MSFIAFCFLLLSCTNPVPKPQGYYRIDLPAHQYKKFNQYPEFSFELSQYTTIEPVIDTVKGEWFNIDYTGLNAKIYCSYYPIKSSELNKYIEDNHKLVYRHVMKADAITEQPFSDVDKNVFGVLYCLEGNVASPLQFTLTDSIANFFRASLMFNTVPNQDSITPVLEYIKEDIRHLIESFEWKSCTADFTDYTDY